MSCDYEDVNCDDVRDAISARLDDEAAPLGEREVADHLSTCQACRAWLADTTALTQNLRELLVPTGPPPELTVTVMRAVSADLQKMATGRREERALRVGLVAVALVQLVLAVPVLVLGHDHAAPLHVAHEVGSFDAAVAIGLIAAARRPRLAAGMLPLVAAITGLLLITAGSDLAAGRTDVLDEAPHLLDLLGALMLRRLSVMGGPGSASPPGLLMPLPAGNASPRHSRSPYRAAEATRRAGPGLISAANLAVRCRSTARALARRGGLPLRAWQRVRLLTRRVGFVIGLAALTLAGVASPASAHVVHQGDDPTNWRTTITSVIPAVPGLTVTSAEAGQRIGVANLTGRTVVVLGYYGEPFLRFSAGTVAANMRSETAHDIILSLSGAATFSPATEPVWHAVAHGTTWWWHDPRTHFTGYALPPPVAARPGRFVHYQDWHIGLIVGGQPVTVTGALDWVPGSSHGRAWVVAAGLLVLAGTVGWMRRWPLPLILSLLAVTALDVVHAVGSVEGRVGSTANKLAALPGYGALICAVWVVSLAACVAAWRRRPAAAYLGLLGAGLTVLIDALPSAGVLWRSQAVTALSHGEVAWLIAVMLGAGTGTSVACFALLLRLDPVPSAQWTTWGEPERHGQPEEETVPPGRRNPPDPGN